MPKCGDCPDFEPLRESAEGLAVRAAKEEASARQHVLGGEVEAAPNLTDFPNCFDPDSLDTREFRAYFVVVATDGNRVRRILQTPSLRECDEHLLFRALRPKLTELSRAYRLPEHDIVVGQGSLDSLMADLPHVRGWQDVSVEDLSL